MFDLEKYSPCGTVSRCSDWPPVLSMHRGRKEGRKRSSQGSDLALGAVNESELPELG